MKDNRIKYIQILGPYNSGTNLISKILNENLSNVNINPLKKLEPLIIWKHTIDKNKLFRAVQNNKNTLFICIYKPIFNWIHSIFKSSYEIKIENKNIKSSCQFIDKKYNNLIEIYNEYYLNYIKLISNFDNVIYMNYYDFISKNSKNYINSKLKKFKLKITKNNIQNILNNPGKNHGISVKSAEEALKNREINYQKIKNKEYIIKYYNNNINKFFK